MIKGWKNNPEWVKYYADKKEKILHARYQTELERIKYESIINQQEMIYGSLVKRLIPVGE